MRLKTISSRGKSGEPMKQKVGTKMFASNAKVSDQTKENQSSLHVLYVKVNTLFEIAPYSKRKTLRIKQNM